MTDNDKPPVKRVVGLQYQPGQGVGQGVGQRVPRVVLKGLGGGADEVLDKAAQLPAGPPVVQDKQLLDRLYRLPVDAPIDPDLFELVAVLLVHIYAADERLTQQHR